jgi:hypothetical protein
VKRPMMIDAIVKSRAAAKVKAISFSIRLPPGTGGSFGCLSLRGDFPPRQ